MTMLTPASVHALLTERGIRPKKALGQNFLVDPNTARRIVALAELAPGTHVLEIGPGLGSLTLALVQHGADIVAVELDERVAAALKEVLAAAGVGDRVRVVVGDANDIDLDALLGDEHWACVSNLPYNVAVPVVVRLLEEVPRIDRLLVMVQREVGERLAASPGDNEYGAVSVKVAYYAETALVGSVPPTVFIPRPKVDSVLVRLRRRSEAPVSVPSVTDLFVLVRAGFAQRRKMLRRALTPVLGDRTIAVLDAAGVDPTTRAEELGLAEWAAVARNAAAAA